MTQMNEQTSPAFRIGGIYRDQGGDLVRLNELIGDGGANGVMLTGQYKGLTSGFRDLATGRYSDAGVHARWTLIPGECDEQGNPIAPVTFYATAETLAAIEDEKAQPECNAAMIARDGPARCAVTAILPPTIPATKPVKPVLPHWNNKQTPDTATTAQVNVPGFPAFGSADLV